MQPREYMQVRDLLTEKRLRSVEAPVSEIDLDTLKKKLQNQEVFGLVEVSEKADFEAGHIQNAIPARLEEILDVAGHRFRKFQQIIIYTSEASSRAAMLAGQRLQQAGFANVVVLKGGKEAWRNAQLPLDGTHPHPEPTGD